MKKYLKIFLMLITSLLLINLVNAGNVTSKSSFYDLENDCKEWRNCYNSGYDKGYSSEKGCIGKINSNIKALVRSECFETKNPQGKEKYIYNVCSSGDSFCPTGDSDTNYSNKQSNSNNEDVPYKKILDSLLEKVILKKAEKTDNDYEKFLNEAIDYVNKLGEKDKYKNNPKTKAVIVYLQNGLQDIKNDFDKNKNNQDLYDLLCDLGSCDKNNSVINNTNQNNTTNTGTNINNNVGNIERCGSKNDGDSFPPFVANIRSNVGKGNITKFHFKSDLNPNKDSDWSYKDQFKEKYLDDILTVRLNMDPPNAYNYNFKYFIPPGTSFVMNIFYYGAGDCYKASVKYWMGGPIKPKEKGESQNDDFKNGKYYLETTGLQQGDFSPVPLFIGNSSDKTGWVYFELKLPENVNTLATSYINSEDYCVSGTIFDIRTQLNFENKRMYMNWYNNKAKWEKNGDPAYDCKYEF